MTELELIQDFRAAVPAPTADARAAALARLTARWERPRWRLAGRRRLLLVAAMLVAVLAVGAAFGLRDQIMDLVRGKPAPSSLAKGPLGTFGPSELPAEMPEEEKARARGYEVTGEWRGVLGVRTSVGPLTLWKATSRNGGVCWNYIWMNADVTRWIAPAEGGCDQPGWRSSDPWPSGRYASGQRKHFPRGRPTLAVDIGRYPHPQNEIKWLRGRAALEVKQVEIRFRNGSRRRVTVYDTFVATELPEISEVRRVVPLDARGRALPCNYKRLCTSPERPFR